MVADFHRLSIMIGAKSDIPVYSGSVMESLESAKANDESIFLQERNNCIELFHLKKVLNMTRHNTPLVIYATKQKYKCRHYNTTCGFLTKEELILYATDFIENLKKKGK